MNKEDLVNEVAKAVSTKKEAQAAMGERCLLAITQTRLHNGSVVRYEH
jgi:hypothetical protein